MDSHFTHYAWRNTPITQGGIGSIDITLVSDLGGEVMKAYGISHPNHVALRASFLIDRKSIVRHQIVNDLPLGRNADELLRMVDALQFSRSVANSVRQGGKKESPV